MKTKNTILYLTLSWLGLLSYRIYMITASFMKELSLIIAVGDIVS